MNKQNLIKLGAFLQKQWDMKPNFNIMETASDNPNKVIIHDYGYGYIEIELEKIGFTDNFETIWAGYSPINNILIIKDSQDRIINTK